MYRHMIVVVFLSLLTIQGVSAQATEPQEESAWEALMQEDPDAKDDLTTPLERRILHLLTPEQGEAFGAGADPQTLILSSGESLADYLARGLKGLVTHPDGLVYNAIDSCTVLRTGLAVDGPLRKNEIRDLLVRGETIDLSSQGGSVTGCGVPSSAEAVLMNFLIVSTGGSGKLRAWGWDSPEPPDALIEYKPTTEDYKPTNASILALCNNLPCGADFKSRVTGAAANVRMDVLGYFTPAPDRHSLDASDGDPVDALSVDANGNVDLDGELDLFDDLQVGTTSQSALVDIYTSGTGLRLFRVGGLKFGELRTNSDNDFVLRPENGLLRTQSDLYLQFSSTSSWRDLFVGQAILHGDLSFRDENGIDQGSFERSGNDILFLDGPGDGHFEVRDRLHVTGDSTDDYLTLGTSSATYITFEEGPSSIRDMNIQMGSGSDGVLRVKGSLTVDNPLTATDVHLLGSLSMRPLPTGAYSGQVCFQQTASGDVVSRCSSSNRYKSNVTSFASGIEAVERLRPVEFQWKTDGSRDVGFIAEEVATVDPLLVTYHEGRIDGVKYDRLTTLLVNSVKEQQAEIERLQAIVCLDHPEAEFCS